jgi:hypothetical protein
MERVTSLVNGDFVLYRSCSEDDVEFEPWINKTLFPPVIYNN